MINSIQILRAFAAFAVFFSHYALFKIHIGSFGVDIFFIISGFIIALVVNKTTKHFLIKRIIRVSPLYIIATFVTIFLALLKPSWFKSVIVNTEAVLKSLLYIPYRIKNSGPILSLGWTLNFEMLFYLAMFLCICILKNKKYLITACSVLLIVFLILLNLDSYEYYPFKFYKNGLLPEFIYGLFSYYLWEVLNKFKKRSSFRMLFIVMGFLSLLFLIYNGSTNQFNFLSRNIRTGIPCLFLVFAFMSIEPYLKNDNKIVKWLTLVGESSYAMYLFHPFILFGFTRLIFPYIFDDYNSVLIEIIKFILVSVVLIIVSILIYKFLDKPLNEYLRRKILNTRK